MGPRTLLRDEEEGTTVESPTTVLSPGTRIPEEETEMEAEGVCVVDGVEGCCESAGEAESPVSAGEAAEAVVGSTSPSTAGIV